MMGIDLIYSRGPGLAKFGLHAANDWCHICGARTDRTVDVFYEENAEHPKGGLSEYVRVCSACVGKMRLILGSED